MTKPLYEWTYEDVDTKTRPLSITVIANCHEQAEDELNDLLKSNDYFWGLDGLARLTIASIRQIHPRAKTGKAHTFE